ncbi:hypothetical protein ACFT5B_17965 [Luteimicrobium sp. NPDC057192]|uniref:hypothetical protein n=1 Tax=Luteimicrobium sp. NPDC057192 TaxID=3346042 RepID=UPI003637780A
MLVELPDVIATDDWVDLTEADDKVYREARRRGTSWRCGRRRGSRVPAAVHACAKLDRLAAIVAEAREEGRSTVVSRTSGTCWTRWSRRCARRG